MEGHAPSPFPFRCRSDRHSRAAIIVCRQPEEALTGAARAIDGDSLVINGRERASRGLMHRKSGKSARSTARMSLAGGRRPAPRAGSSADLVTCIGFWRRIGMAAGPDLPRQWLRYWCRPRPATASPSTMAATPKKRNSPRRTIAASGPEPSSGPRPIAAGMRGAGTGNASTCLDPEVCWMAAQGAAASLRPRPPRRRRVHRQEEMSCACSMVAVFRTARRLRHVPHRERGCPYPLRRSVSVPRSMRGAPNSTRRNPLARVPVLELDDESHLANRVAICRYFEELHPEPALFGTGALERAPGRDGGTGGRNSNFTPLVQAASRHTHTLEWRVREVPQIPESGEVNRGRALSIMAFFDSELGNKTLSCRGILLHRGYHRLHLGRVP